MPPLYFTELQTMGTENEWIELTNTVDHPIDLREYSITTYGGSGTPSSFFGGYENLSAFGTPAIMENQTYFLNAEDLYIDDHFAQGTGINDNFYLYKVANNGNNFGKYYYIGFHYTNWWDSNAEVFLNESQKYQKEQSYLEAYVYQITLPHEWYFGYQYVRLETSNDHKYEQNMPIGESPSGWADYLDLDWESLVDGHVTTPNTETQALADYWLAEYGITMKSSTLRSIYVKSDLHYGWRLDFVDDNDGTTYANTNVRTNSNFWKISSLPYEGKIFVNDNHPDTTLYYSHYTGGMVSGPGTNIEEIDLTNETHFKHYTNEAFFQNTSRTYGSTTIDFTSTHVRSQITTVTLQAPILADTIYVNKNNGWTVSGPGEDIVEIDLDLHNENNGSWLFPIGATYRDHSTSGSPLFPLPHLIVVTDQLSDPDGNKNELYYNGIVYIWNWNSSIRVKPGLGWGTNGPAPEPAGGWSIQAYFDGDRYYWGNHYTLGTESKGTDNSVVHPAYGSVNVVINEINGAFIELYNRGNTAVTLNGWKITGMGAYAVLSGIIQPGGFQLITEPFIFPPFHPGTGGRFSLFDDLGVLTSSIGYQTDVSGNQYSFTQRHIDGVGPDFAYNDSMATPWAMGVEGAQKNADWDIAQPRSTGSENYDGITFLQIGKMDGQPWGLIEDLSDYNPEWTDGILGAERIEDMYSNNWDIVFCLSGVSSENQWVLNEYIPSVFG